MRGALLPCWQPAGFLAIFLVPQLKYPSNPPSVGQPETIGYRSELFFLMILISVAALSLAIVIAPRLSARYGNWNAALLAAAVFIVIIVLAQVSSPDINEVPDQFPAVVLWRFRVVSVGIQLILWCAMAVWLFGAGRRVWQIEAVSQIVARRNRYALVLTSAKREPGRIGKGDFT